MICYVAGITTIVWLPVLPPLIFGVLLIVPLLFRRLLPVSMVAFFLGAGWSLLWCHWQMGHRLHSEPLKADWNISGEVVGLPEQSLSVVRFNFQVDTITPHKGADLRSPAPRKLRLSWYRPTFVIKPGQRLSMTVRLKPPHGYANPDGFDYERWLFARGIDATGYVRALHEKSAEVRCGVGCMRFLLLEYIIQRYPTQEVHALIGAITLGARSAFDDSQWQQLRATGTIHLAVISGLHIGFAALLGMLLAKGAVWLFPGLNARLMAAFAGISCAFLYMLLAGAALPTQRAFVMVAIFLLAQWRLWHVDLWSRWWAAMAVVLTLLPIATHEVGFWLSFCAVAVLLWLAGLRMRDLIGWRVQLAICLAMAPLLVFMFGGVSIVAPLINLIAIPLVAVLLLASLLDLTFSLFSIQITAQFVVYLVDAFWALVGFGAALQPELWEPDAPSLMTLLFAALGIFLLLQPAGFPARWLGVLICFPLVFGAANSGPERDQKGFEVWVFDVGQGLSVLVEADGKVLLYDTGPAFVSGRSNFSSTVLPYLERKRHSKIDLLVLSHNDLDHTGGHSVVRAELAVLKGMTGSPELVDKFNYGACRKGQEWTWGTVRFEVLAGSEGVSDNNRSCVLRVSDRYCSMLLTGDIDLTVEGRLLPGQQQLNWLIASHHGSKTGSSGVFLQRWRPQEVIFSSGYANRFNHPDPVVLQRVSEVSARSLLTAEQGALYLHSSSDGVCRAQGWREIRKRFWSSG